MKLFWRTCIRDNKTMADRWSFISADRKFWRW